MGKRRYILYFLSHHTFIYIILFLDSEIGRLAWIGELESYIAELEDRPVSVDALYLNIPKEERKEIKVKVCEEYTYKLLVQRQKDLEQRLKQSRDSYENLLLSYIKLVNQKDKN